METKDNSYSLEDIAKMCEVAIILEGKVKCEDLHDFFSDHVKPLYDYWLSGMGEGIYKMLNEHEEAFITEYANRVANDLSLKKLL